MTSVRLEAPLRIVIGLVAVFAVAVAACGNDDDAAPPAAATEAPQPAETPAPSETPHDQPAAGATPVREASGESGSAQPAPETPEEPPPVPLTASYRGVTENSIKIGVLLNDQEAILALGIDLKLGDVEAHFQTRIDELNARGGVLGRRIDAVYEYFSPVSNASAEAACVKLAEDEEVFMVLGQQRFANNALCYTSLYDIPFLGTPGILLREDWEQSELPMVSIETAPWRLVNAVYAAMEAEEAGEGGVIGVFASSREELDAVREGLLGRGASRVVSAGRSASESDMVALGGEIDLQIERFRADGVTAVVNLGNSVAVLGGFARNGYAVPYYVITPDVLVDFVKDQGATDDELRLARAVLPPDVSDLYVQGHEPTVQCVNDWNAARPDETAIPHAGDDAEFLNILSVARACLHIDLLETSLLAGGTELTTASWASGLDEIGSFEGPTAPAASVSSTKWDVNDTAVLYTWDEETQTVAYDRLLDMAG